MKGKIFFLIFSIFSINDNFDFSNDDNNQTKYNFNNNNYLNSQVFFNYFNHENTNKGFMDVPLKNNSNKSINKITIYHHHNFSKQNPNNDKNNVSQNYLSESNFQQNSNKRFYKNKISHDNKKSNSFIS